MENNPFRTRETSGGDDPRLRTPQCSASFAARTGRRTRSALTKCAVLRTCDVAAYRIQMLPYRAE